LLAFFVTLLLLLLAEEMFIAYVVHTNFSNINSQRWYYRMHRSCLEARQKKMKRTEVRKNFSPYSSDKYFDNKSERFLENISLQIWKPNKTNLCVNPDFVDSGNIKLETPNVENFSINTFEELHVERNLPMIVSPDQGRLRPLVDPSQALTAQKPLFSPKKVESIPLQTFVTQGSQFSGDPVAPFPQELSHHSASEEGPDSFIF
jgi:hypothetical protein